MQKIIFARTLMNTPPSITLRGGGIIHTIRSARERDIKYLLQALGNYTSTISRVIAKVENCILESLIIRA